MYSRCELEPTSAEIGEAFYGQEKKVHLILRNIGQVTANFQFMPLPGAMFGDDKDKNFRTAPRWATVEPEQASLWAFIAQARRLVTLLARDFVWKSSC